MKRIIIPDLPTDFLIEVLPNYGMRPTEDTLDKLGIFNDLDRRRARLKECACCGVHFVGDWQAKTCSEGCAKHRHGEQVTAENRRRQQNRLSWYTFYGKESCTHCGKTLLPGERQRYRPDKNNFCSASCRVSYWRKQKCLR